MTETTLQVKELIPLALLYSADNRQIEGRTRMQKLVFLTQDRLEDEGVDTLEYVPYKYGPFSKSLIETIEKFESMGLLTREKERTYDGSEKYIYSLRPKGAQSFRYNLESGSDPETLRSVLDAAEAVLDEHDRKSLRRLIDHVYEEYPEYATESVY